MSLSTIPEAERSHWEVQDSDDDEVTLTVRKMNEEVIGKRGGTVYHTPTDSHLYRFFPSAVIVGCWFHHSQSVFMLSSVMSVQFTLLGCTRGQSHVVQSAGKKSNLS